MNGGLFFGIRKQVKQRRGGGGVKREINEGGKGEESEKEKEGERREQDERI